MLLHILDEFFHRFRNIQLAGIDLDLAGFGCFIRRRDTREVRDFASAGAAVQAFVIAVLTDIERGGSIHTMKLVVSYSLSGAFTVRPVRGNKGGQHDEIYPPEQGRNLAYTANVHGTVFRRKSEIDVQTAAQIVAVLYINLITLLEQSAFKLDRQGLLNGTRQPGKPQNTAATPVPLHVHLIGDGLFDGLDIG